MVEIEGLVSGKELDKIYKKRSVQYVYKTLVMQDIGPYEQEGWVRMPSRKKKTVKLRKLKDFSSGFEDEVWGIFYRLGFVEMNKDSTNFTIPRYGTDVSKQIDVFAREEQCVCIVECKSAEKPHTKKPLGTEIDQLNTIQRGIDISINKYYEEKGLSPKIKYIWILALKNIDLSDPDRDRAIAANIKVMDSSLLEYYDEFSRHYGQAAKFQFLSDLLPKREIPDLIEPIPAMKGKMGDTPFFSFVIEPGKLLKLAFIAHRSKTGSGTLETYQRMAKKTRLAEIKKYIHDEKGIFPTGIVLNFETDHPLRFDKAKDMAGKNVTLGTLYLPNIYQCAWIIDGQHRLFAFAGLDEAKTATLPVIAFENLKTDKQAELFVKINGKQRRVPTNLLNDIFADLHWDSYKPEDRLSALISRLLIQLNKSPDSVLRDRIKRAEEPKSHTSRNLTLTGLATEIKKQRLVGEVQGSKAEEISPGPLSDTSIKQEDLDGTLKRASDIINRYYELICRNDTVRQQWDLGNKEGGYICTNHGIQATLRVLRAILDHLEYKDHISVRNLKPGQLMTHVEKYLNPVTIYLATAPSRELADLRKSTGEAGVRESTFVLFSCIHKEFPAFAPSGLMDWLKTTDVSLNAEARDLILDKIEPMVHEYIFRALRAHYGPDPNEYWIKGVPQEIRKKAVVRGNEEGESKDFERFIDLVDNGAIIESHPEIFGDTFTIDATPNDKKSKRVAWLSKLNLIRQKVAHTVKSKGVTGEELEYVMHIYEELQKKIGASGKTSDPQNERS